MNWYQVVETGRLVYQSKEDDCAFRNWFLRKTRCNVSYYETYPLEDIDKIICSVLSDNGGKLDEYELATIMGFNVKDNFDVTPKRYADEAELLLFRDIVRPVFDWGLISRENTKTGMDTSELYFLTELGERAVQRHEKYKFFRGRKLLFENLGVNATSEKDSDFFPYFEELGICSVITDVKEIDCHSINNSVFDVRDCRLIERMRLQSSSHLNIYSADETSFFEVGAAQVDVSLYELDGVYYLIVFLNGCLCCRATSLLNNGANASLKSKKVEWGLYLHLMNDASAKLDYKTILPFEDILNIGDLIKDDRLIWSDNELFLFLSKNADADQSTLISSFCPLEIIKKHINVRWDWIVLSQRFDMHFIVENPLLPWDFEIVSSREDVNIEDIKLLLQDKRVQNADWNWEEIMPKLDFDFIEKNINDVDFDFYMLTRTGTDAVKELVFRYPNKKWDWSYISNEYDLEFLLSFLSVLSQSANCCLNLNAVIDRAFHSPQYASDYCSSVEFREVVNNNRSSISIYSINKSDFLWSDSLIEFFEGVGLLSWPSGTFTDGFECNPYVIWNQDYFEKYNAKISTERGFSFVSNAISDYKIVVDHQNFNWDWNCISNNDELLSDDNFVKIFISKLSLVSALPRIRGSLIEELFLNFNLLDFLSDDRTLWTKLTQKVSVEFVFNHLAYAWDWRYLTAQLDKKLIFDNLPECVNYWDWNILVESRLDKCDLTLASHLPMVATCISSLSDDLKSELWMKITRKFNCKELLCVIDSTNLISCCSGLFDWDLDYLYSLADFDVYSYLQNHLADVRWDLLSKSYSLNQYLKWDEKIYSEERWGKNTRSLLENENYKWNFTELSKIDSINSCADIISIRIQEWDWQYLTANSKLFEHGRFFVKYFKKFIDNIDFKALSSRTDSGVNQDTIRLNIDRGWDWAALSKNETIKFQIDFIQKYNEKAWDWHALSSREDIVIDNDTLVSLKDKDWDWTIISSRNDININNKTLFALKDKEWDWDKIVSRPTIKIDEEFIEELHEAPIDWYVISQNENFVPNQLTLSKLKNKSLDWDAISQNSHLDESILWDYREKLNWKHVTRNKVNCANTSDLEKFSGYIDWNFVSNSPNFSLTIPNLRKFKSKLNWNIISQRLHITNEVIDNFADVLDWNAASKSRYVEFTEEFVEKYHAKWDWSNLFRTLDAEGLLDRFSSKYRAKYNCKLFIERFESKPYIYHFTHLFNAIDVIKERKIKSRNRADGRFSNAAGSVVDRRYTAHEFARFYFRPKTPTQFYNECLGWDKELRTSDGKSYYYQAEKLGLPKCPMPVFFKFDLEEVIGKFGNICYYSTGNMQTDRALVKKISEEPKGLSVEYLYSQISDAYNKARSDGRYNRDEHLKYMSLIKEQSQQEFLVLDVLDFSELESFEVICYDKEQAEILKSQLKGDPIVDKIKIDEYDVLYHRFNRKIRFSEVENAISISSDYCGDAYFKLISSDKSVIIGDNKNVKCETSDSVSAYPAVRFLKTDNPIEVHFIDELRRDWMIYKN